MTHPNVKSGYIVVCYRPQNTWVFVISYICVMLKQLHSKYAKRIFFSFLVWLFIMGKQNILPWIYMLIVTLLYHICYIYITYHMLIVTLLYHICLWTAGQVCQVGVYPATSIVHCNRSRSCVWGVLCLYCPITVCVYMSHVLWPSVKSWSH